MAPNQFKTFVTQIEEKLRTHRVKRLHAGPKHVATYFAAVILGLALMGPDTRARAEVPGMNRFYYSGDGQISLASQKNGQTFAGRYRTDRGRYDPAALKAICNVYGAPYDPELSHLSLRLVEYLDFLQDRLRPEALITITSGYRSPQYNTQVRRRGGLAAKASLHQYGMAADLKMEGVSARHLWDTVKAFGFGGAGYYHGQTVHIDVGPARSWDEKSSGVGTGISDDNKLIGLVSDYDRYRPGETVTLRFIRMTAFPIGVSTTFALDRQAAAKSPQEVALFQPTFALSVKSDCPRFSDIGQMAAIRWQLPEDLPFGRYKVRALFCGVQWETMPPEVSTSVFEIVGP